jgi:hypothetical protein
MPATLLHVFLLKDVSRLMSLTNAIRVINVGTILVMRTLDVYKPAITATTMITVLMTAANHLLDVHIPHMTVMTITTVPLKNVHQENVTTAELTVMMVIIVLMIAVK